MFVVVQISSEFFMAIFFVSPLRGKINMCSQYSNDISEGGSAFAKMERERRPHRRVKGAAKRGGSKNRGRYRRRRLSFRKAVAPPINL